ncbi:MAG: hypothetical protein JNM36_06725 [Chitinophagales bacterium]|jgi:hypothetical protein|nr:hypothetical protein [Chitinophagales bacterium]
MSLDALKLSYIGKRLQVVIIDKNGFLIDTCNTLLTIPATSISLFDNIVLLDSLRHHLSQLKIEDTPLFFPNIEFIYNQQTIVVDSTFFVNTHNESQIVWILDNDPYDYRALFNMQQERNELAIRSFYGHCNKKMVENLQIIDQANEKMYYTLVQYTAVQEQLAQPIQHLDNVIATLQEYVGKMYLRELIELSNQLQTNIQKIPAPKTYRGEEHFVPLLSLLNGVSNAIWVTPQLTYNPIIGIINLQESDTNILLPEIAFRQILYNWLYLIVYYSKSAHISLNTIVGLNELQLLCSHQALNPAYRESYHWQLCEAWLNESHSHINIDEAAEQSCLTITVFQTNAINATPIATSSANISK